jgi:hypothetical protein
MYQHTVPEPWRYISDIITADVLSDTMHDLVILSKCFDNNRYLPIIGTEKPERGVDSTTIINNTT